MSNVFPWQKKATGTYQKIKQHYLSRGHSHDEWQHVVQNPSLFNAAWRAMLAIPVNAKPPPDYLRVDSLK